MASRPWVKLVDRMGKWIDPSCATKEDDERLARCKKPMSNRDQTQTRPAREQLPQQRHSRRDTTASESQSEPKPSGWSLRTIGDCFFRKNPKVDSQPTGSDVDQAQSPAAALAQPESDTERNGHGLVDAPDEQEAWRFVDTVYEAALTRVS